MANVLGELFQNIADAIRSKTGSTDTLKPNQFPEAIEGITTGGGSSADVRYVTFRNESTGEEYKKPVAYGDDCVDVVAKGLWKTPTKESTAQYNYTYYGWGASDGGAADANILKNITEDKTVYAIFTSTVRYYTITWLDEDGTELPGQKQWAYGTVPSYEPKKDGYTISWTPEPSTVTGDATYTATWTEDAVRWTLENGTLTYHGNGPTDDYTYANSNTRPWYSKISTIKKIIIGDGITKIGDHLFRECPNVTSITLGKSISSIGANSFYYCTSLTEVVIPNSVTTMGSGAFGYCTSLQRVVIQDGLVEVPTTCFLGCTSLAEIALGANIATISRQAFQGTAITQITIPAATTSIDWSAFNLTHLSEIIVEAGNTAYLVGEDGCVYNTSKTTLCRVPVSKTQYTFPSTVIAMEQGCFVNCVNLSTLPISANITEIPTVAYLGCAFTEVIIPENITKIGANAFSACASLTKVTIGEGVRTIGANAFSSCTRLSTATFKQTSGWRVYSSETSTSGTYVSISSTTSAATYLRETHVSKWWRRS